MREARRRKPVIPRKNMHAILTVGRPSVVPVVAMPSLALAAWAAIVSGLYALYGGKGGWLNGLPTSQLLITLLGVVMGLLLVFRTNTAYDRFYEGRKTWASVQSNLRSLARLIWVGTLPKDEDQKVQRAGAMRLLIAFAAATKHHLRNEGGNDFDDLAPFLDHIPAFALSSNDSNGSSSRANAVSRASFKNETEGTLPIDIVFHLQKYVTYIKNTGQIDANVQLVASNHVNSLSDCISIFERIRTTPIPVAYEYHLKQTLVVYLLSLPFQIVTTLQWYTIPATLVAAFTMFGIEAIGGEIENPFGYDANDLPQDEFVDSIRDEVLGMMGEAKRPAA
ncbi:hypothetical protein HDU78_009857 [Chytriomyces hyalinus]|uniref:Uncharacterized protein n=1 Tax=Chytriomyces confervae TaxID=246404 RepID=A0A507FIA2_9FUNG|nr:hypothetical protein HDU78_009857 [Chytriomyces hyalinus]KAJ3267355.1 hypothetical protein HDU77_000069 [Chytriomyces hyalinus]KAJ3406127.1 hypothetical protein HDU80_000134 [Chytriomyces hyalinus]TPX75942.1 hypothetical protein CcCBS67573_g02798 [Chytriomyces confervae]